MPNSSSHCRWSLSNGSESQRNGKRVLIESGVYGMAYCERSLHGTIVATAFALPRVSLRHPAATGRSSKQTAFAATWDKASLPAEVDLHDIAEGIHATPAVKQGRLQHQGRRLARLHRQGFIALCLGLT